MEDVAIAYGYNNLVKTVPKTVTVGRELPLNQVWAWPGLAAAPLPAFLHRPAPVCLPASQR